MQKISAVIQNLSLDVTVGAVVSSAFVCHYFQVTPDWHIMLGLAIAIWLIYTVDHLRDARNSDEDTLNPRHAFHRKYWKQISAFAAFMFAVGVVNAFWLPMTTIWCGVILGAVSGMYFLYLKFSTEQSLKELLAAVIYSAGIFAAPISLLQNWEWYYLLFFMLFFLLVAANLVLFPLYEMDIDQQGRMKSIALKRGVEGTKTLVWILLTLHILLLIIAVWLLPNFSVQAVTFTVMNLVLVFLTANQHRFRKHQAYRWLGDGIFLLPLVSLLMA